MPTLVGGAGQGVGKVPENPDISEARADQQLLQRFEGIGVLHLVYQECVKAFGKDAVSFDGLGSVLAVRPAKKPGKPRVMLAAHMDEVGLLVVSATDDGLLRFRAIGGIDARVLVSKRVRVGYDTPEKPSLQGVIGAMAIHQQTPEDRKAVLPIDQLYIDIGAKDKADAEKLAPAGIGW